MIIEFNKKYRKEINYILYSSVLWQLDRLMKKNKKDIYTKVVDSWNNGDLFYNPFNNILYGRVWDNVRDYLNRRFKRI